MYVVLNNLEIVMWDGKADWLFAGGKADCLLFLNKLKQLSLSGGNIRLM